MTTFGTTHLYLLLLCLTVACCGPKRKITSFKNPENFCGPTLTHYLHSFCEHFYEPTDLEPTTSQRDIAEECCQTPCSMLYLILAYCKTPNLNAIKTIYGENEYNHFHKLRQNISDNTLEMVYKDQPVPDSVTPISETEKMDGSVRQKKHIRKHRQKRCQCKQSLKVLKKKKILLERTVPQYAIGEIELHDNEPIILTNIID